jgi:fructose-specific component phosphotransferase system IIB-like protein
MASFEEYMNAARRADKAGDEAAARRLVQAALRVRETPVAAPTVPETPTVPEPAPVPVAAPVAAPTFEVGEAAVVETEEELPGFDLPRERRPTLPAEFAPVEETERRLAELVDKRVQEAFEARGDLPFDPTRFEAERRRDIEEDIARQREQMIIAGREDKPVEPTAFTPLGRPSRIVELQARAQRDEDFEGFRIGEVERLYRDPDTGDLRPPTAFEELFETFAAQPVLTEAEARAADEEVQRRKRDIQTRIGAGEQVSFEEAQLLDPAMSVPRTLSGAIDRASKTESETGAVSESALGASLRSIPAFLSAIGRDVYFEGLGYEVDEQGRPLDPADFGYQVAKVRESLGFPAVATKVPNIGTGKLVPLAAPFPLPGVAIYARREADVVGTDPEARRQRPDIEGPSLLDDPTGWFEAEARRIARTISNDRGMGDDFVDAPEVRAAYADLYGDPDAAFWGGSLYDVLVPAGPGTIYRNAKRGLSLMGEVAGETKTAQRAAETLISRAEANNQTRAQRSFSNAAADVAAIVVPGRASDGRVVRKVADNVVDVTPGLDDAERAAMKAAVKATSNTPSEVVRDMARAIDRPVNDPDVQRLLTEVELRTPDDLVMVSEAVAVPRDIAPRVRTIMGDAARKLQRADTPAEQARILREYEMPAYARRVEELGGLNKLEPRVQNVLREQVKTQAAYRATPDIARQVRKLDKVSEYNAYVDRMAVLKPSLTKGAFGPLARRIGAVYGSKNYVVNPASVLKTTRALRAAGASATRQVRQALVAEARTSRSAEEALNKVFARELADESVDALYAKILGDMYGGEKVPNLMRLLKVDDEALGKRLLTDMPTVDSLRRIDEHAVANGYVPAVGPGPEVDRAMLRAILEEGVRKRVARGGKEFEAAIIAEGTRKADAAEGVGGFFKVPDRLDPAAGAPGSRIREYRVRVDPEEEGRLIEGIDELVKVLGNEPGIARLGWGNWLSQQTSRIGQNLRDAEYAMRYGYYLPNVPYLVGRAVSIPIVSLATIGAENTMRALARAAGKAVPDGATLYPRSRRLGLGIPDPDGVYYSPQILDDLLEIHGGLGRTAIDQARISRLGRDIMRDVARAAGGRGRALLSDANPFAVSVRNFFMQTAEAVELSYRRSVFESAIAHGVLPSDAALLARRSLLPYDELPDAFTEGLISRLFVDAGEKLLLVKQFADLAVRNPEQITRIAKATRLKQKAQDPYGLEGDRTLKSLGIFPVQSGDRELTIYGPTSPHLRPLEATLDILRSADFTAQRFIEAVKQGTRAEYSGALNSGLEGAGEVVRYGASELLPGVLDAFERTVGDIGRPGEVGRDLRAFGDEEAFWAALLAADLADPRRDAGIWQATIDLLDPQVVQPPDGFGLEGELGEKFPNVWVVQPPEGTPFLALGTTRDGIPMYEVFEPSARGARNLSVIRSLPTSTLEQAFGVGASLYADSDNVDVDALFPRGAAGAVGRLVGGRAVDTRDPAVTRAKQTEAIRAVREDVR